MKENRFFICEHCGNIVGIVHDSGVPLMCCGQKMKQLIPGTVEASHEKHIPVVTREDNLVKVTIGSVAHPMTEEHSITWVYLQTCCGGQRKALKPGDEPTVTFALYDEKPIAVYAYCNLHGLWKTDIVEEKKCEADTKPVNAAENYKVCNCKNVTYMDIVDALSKHEKIENVLDAFEHVKDTTNCSTGCGGCHDKVIDIISETMMGGEKL